MSENQDCPECGKFCYIDLEHPERDCKNRKKRKRHAVYAAIPGCPECRGYGRRYIIAQDGNRYILPCNTCATRLLEVLLGRYTENLYDCVCEYTADELPKYTRIVPLFDDDIEMKGDEQS